MFPVKFMENFDFSGNLKKIEFPGKNLPFTATSWQIILFLFKSHHFRTYFLCMIRYNNISRPPATPSYPRLPAHNRGVTNPQPPGLTPLHSVQCLLLKTELNLPQFILRVDCD